MTAILGFVALMAVAPAGKVVILGDGVVAEPLVKTLSAMKGLESTTALTVSARGGVAALSPAAKAKLLASVARADPSTVVVDFGHDDVATFTHLGREAEAFEPKLRDLLAALANLPTHPRVVMAPPVPQAPESSQAIAEILNVYLIPLEKQAVRESGAEWADIDETSLLGSAEELADLIAPRAAKANWRIVHASSEQADEGPATNAIDGDPNTYWHTEYDPVLAKPPHELVIDLGQSIWLAGIRYTPRQDGGVNGIARDYEVYVGDSPDKVDALAAKGAFKRGPDRKSVRFAKPIQGRYLRFVILSAQNREAFGGAAEIDIIRDHTHE